MDSPKIKFSDLQQSVNIASLPAATDKWLDHLGSEVVSDYEADDRTRDGWKKRNGEAMKLALQVAEAKTYPWAGASNVKFPLLSQAALQFNVRAYGQLAKAPDLVKMRVTGEDENGAKAARASRVGQHMSYQNINEDANWEDGFDKLLMVLPIMGICYRKKYWHAETQMLQTTTVLPQHLVVPYHAKSLEDTPRKTEWYEIYDRKIKERELAGLYRKVDLGLVKAPEPDESERDAQSRTGINQDIDDKKLPRPFIEQHLFLDLDKDGYEEPYIVTVDLSSKKVLRIVQRYKEVVSRQTKDIDSLNDQLAQLGRMAQEIMAQLQQVPPEQQQQAVGQAKEAAAQIEAQQQQIQQQIQALTEEEPEVHKITPIECFTKYSFIPAPDGSFYDIGFGALLGPLNRSVNSLINQLIDSGSLQNGSQGFLGKGARIKGGKVSFKPYEWKRVNVAGQTLKESIVPLPINQPSAVLFNLLGLLIEYTQQLSSVNDAMTGKDMGQNTPAYNMEAMLNQGMQVFSGIFKRVHRALRREFQEQYRLNAVYLNPEEYFETIDGKDTKILQQDYAGDAKDIYPAADPNAFSQMEKASKAQFLSQRAMAVPGYHPVNVERRLLQAMDIEDVQEIFPLDEQGNMAIPPPPNQELEIKAAEEQRRTLESQSRMEKDFLLAEAKVEVDEANVMLIGAKIKEMGDTTAIKEFDAITKRIKEKREALKQEREKHANAGKDSKPKSD